MADIEPTTSPGRWLETAYALHAATCRLYAHTLAPGAADDVVQEAFVRLVRFGQREGTGASGPIEVRAWLLRAVRSAAIDLKRAEGRRKRREQTVAQHAPPLFVASAHDAIVARETQQALARLEQRTREVVVLRIWGELTFAEVAELTGMKLSTAHETYRRGLETLRAVLDAESPARRPAESEKTL